MSGWFLNLRTGTKLMIAFATALLIAVLVGLAGLWNIEDLARRADVVNRVNRGSLASLIKIRQAADSGYAFLSRRADSNPDNERPTTADERWEVHRRTKLIVEQARILKEGADLLQDLAAGYRAPAGEGKESEETGQRELLQDLSAALKNFETQVQTLPLPGDAAEDGSGTGTPVGIQAARRAYGSVLAESQKLERAVDVLATNAVHDMETARRLGQAIMLGGAAAGALLALLVGIITTRMVVHPLREMTAAAHRISEGDLTATIAHESRDEVGGLADSFRRMQGSLRDLEAEAQRVASGDLTHGVRGGGQLGEAFNRMIESLNALLREIQEAGTQVRGSSARIFAGLQRNAEASKEEAAAVEQVGATMEELSRTARSIAASSTEVEKTADDASRVAAQGTASVGSALEGMFRIRERVNEITGKTMVLGEKCRRIGEVLKIIQDVAGEIHMLALNAAIESAASAGEHGKRFTVVAGEVRRLAERTRQSAEEIRAILIEIQEAAEATVGAAQQGAREVEEGATVAGSARKALEEVISRIHSTTEVAREISRTTHDQRQASEQVAASMRDISRAVRRMAEGTEESTAAVKDLTALAERFGDLTGTFRTG